MTNQDNIAVFEQDEFWDGYYSDSYYYTQKIKLIVNMIPADVETILDVGCGKGDLLRALEGKYEVCGCDRSEAALRYVTCRKTLSGSGNLPFLSEEFNLVTCCQVLEHLPDRIFKDTVSELKRVTKKYILITVPFAETLSQHFTMCGTCRKAYHVSAKGTVIRI